ncbi:MAG TPA: methylmalonyl-CoA mutase [Gammaproteobacteria bacterium]|jgi:methylmalonyl-CoA mutase C-terminal domain/subunit|nr:methylmalonyl-CoA mutase [Acidiferrobacteraceae bacterium]MDP6399537.1 cobalamin-dependent protein [Arenicellales bacterium]HCX87206.1 methylmalonyl-CoA mutase [Gammaproteobacteria bacterium]MDP6552268.1 cobalamin-dependent protein [Arenicellales bacterium]MDP6790549.1 cobalamin-dependent protein [Arenicellales bacterium]|tara:strand:- start:34217 stop:34609 length:393 start_codon:yes stop_codon:yes gene_type:complete
MRSTVKVLIAKPGLDGHDQGAKIVVRALMDAGFEVTYSGLRQTPQQVAQLAHETGADVIGLSSMAGSHLSFCRELKPILAEYGLQGKLWIIGGSIPDQDHTALKETGVDGIFPAGTTLQEIVTFITERAG